MTTPIPVNEMFSFSPEDFNQNAFDKLHDKTTEYIPQSDEYKSLNGDAINASARQIAAGPMRRSMMKSRSSLTASQVLLRWFDCPVLRCHSLAP